jgi:hypothetical protein
MLNHRPVGKFHLVGLVARRPLVLLWRALHRWDRDASVDSPAQRGTFVASDFDAAPRVT